MSRYFIYIDVNNNDTEFDVVANAGVGTHVVRLASFNNKDAAKDYIETLPYLLTKGVHPHKFIADEELIKKYNDMPSIRNGKTMHEIREENKPRARYY
jgi:hypothetical protein